MHIREATASDLDVVLCVEDQAFGREDVTNLTRDLLNDPSAEPLVSLLAFDDEQAVGHILFTAARLEGEQQVATSILAPLAVVPDSQKRGIGGKLIERGLQILSEARVDLVFVLGHPGYYPRHGFQPAGRLGFEAPYPIPVKDADAWMLQSLRSGVIGAAGGKVICADALDQPEHWRE
jgi:putative acetyltransferase